MVKSDSVEKLPNELKFSGCGLTPRIPLICAEWPIQDNIEMAYACKYIQVERCWGRDAANGLIVQPGPREPNSQMIEPKLDPRLVSKVGFETNPILVDSIEANIMPC